MCYKKGWVFVLDTQIDDFTFLLINIYNPYKEKEQVSVLNEITKYYLILKKINKHNIFAGNFNIFLAQKCK